MSEISGGSDDKEDMSTDDKISAYESLLMDCKEAIEVITKVYKIILKLKWSKSSIINED